MKNRRFILSVVAVGLVLGCLAATGPVIVLMRQLYDVRLPAAGSIPDGHAMVWNATLKVWTNGTVSAAMPNPFLGSYAITNTGSAQDLVATNSLSVLGAGPATWYWGSSADAFRHWITRSASQTADANWVLPTTNATGLSYLTASQSSTNHQLGYTLVSSIVSSSQSSTNPITYGPRVFPIGTDSTNINWATNSYTRQGITTNVGLTISFLNAPPAEGAELVFTVNNTATTNIPITFLDGNPITNNVYVRGNTTLTSFDVAPGANKFEWAWNGSKYYFTHEGPPVTFSVYASGTAYTTTATPALTDFGTTDPILTFTAAGTYRLRSGVGVLYNGATYAGAQTIALKLRKTNGTPTDVTNAAQSIELPVLTAFTGGDTVVLPDADFVVARGDVVQLFSSVSATPSAGSVQINSAWIVADRKF